VIVKKVKLLVFLIAGALAGYFYYFFIGCKSGTCPITSNPYTSTFYGLLLGLGLYWTFFADEKKKRE
jgi:phage shock protein E